MGLVGPSEPAILPGPLKLRYGSSIIYYGRPIWPNRTTEPTKRNFFFYPYRRQTLFTQFPPFLFGSLVEDLLI
jgi:hypothetical protein